MKLPELKLRVGKHRPIEWPCLELQPRVRMLILAFSFLLFSQNTFAQEQEITGTVKDTEGVPLPGASVVVKGTTTGTQTDFDGNYTINANDGCLVI